MISNPKYGWCNFKLGDFEGHPSYLTDVPMDLLDMFISYEKTGKGMAFFDEEGDTFSFIINRGSIIIIEERAVLKCHDFSNMKVRDLERELITDIESNLDGWAKDFTSYDITNEEHEYKKALINKVQELKGWYT